jgi:predicted nucleotidyltransferase
MEINSRQAQTFSVSQKEAFLQQVGNLLTERPEVGFAYAYGSFLDDIPCHDIDIGIFMVSRSKIPNTLLFASEISGEIERLIHLPADVRVINDAPVTFLFSVIRGRLFYDRIPETRQQFVEDVMHRYFDIKSVLAHAAKEAFGP